MGLNTWAAFHGSDADAVITGDVAMLDNEVQPVLKAFRWPAHKLATAVRAAVDELAKPSGRHL